MFKQITGALGLLCLAATFTATAAEREWPDREFQCQVITESGARGMVSLQTFSKELAIKEVVGLSAWTDMDGSERAAEVVQCIEPAKREAFKDTAFGYWVSTLEM